MYRGERFNGLSALAGAVLAVVGVPVLLEHAARDPRRLTSLGVYGATLVCLYLFSTLYHTLRGRAKQVFQKLDHTAIYFLIAGTYTPFGLVTLGGPFGYALLATIWSLAVVGTVCEIARGRRTKTLPVALALAMGWLAVFALPPLARALPLAGLVGLLVGGLLYTAGVVFYALDRRLAHGHGIFHLFVLGGSVAHYFVVLAYVA